jgi:AcrR family transcriptional regulator
MSARKTGFASTATRNRPVGERGGRTPATQARGREARTKILEAAELVFAQRGFGAASLDEIGRQAEMSKHRILHYYPSKQALYQAVVEELMSFVSEMLALYEQDDDRDPSFAALDLWVDKLAERPTLARLSLFEMAGPPDEGSPRSFSPFAERITSAFEEVFRRLVPDAEPEERLHFICTIQGATLLYAASLHEAAPRRNRDDRRRLHERHRTLVRRTASELLREIGASAAPGPRPG